MHITLLSALEVRLKPAFPWVRMLESTPPETPDTQGLALEDKEFDFPARST